MGERSSGGRKHVVASPYIVEATRVESQLKIKLLDADEKTTKVYRRALERIGNITGTQKKSGRRMGKLQDAKLLYETSLVRSDKVHRDAKRRMNSVK